MKSLKDLAARAGLTGKTPAAAEPAAPSAEGHAFNWEVPGGGAEAPTAPSPQPERPAVRKRAAETPVVEGAGRAVRWKAATTVLDLATVYKEAGIEPPLHGYGVDKLEEMLRSPHLASLPRDVRATAILAALEAARVPLRDVIDDATLRSKALAAFEADKALELQTVKTHAERRAQALREQGEALVRDKNAEIEGLRRAIDTAEQALVQLQARKRREEERLHRLVAHFVEPRPAITAPVTALAAPPPAPPAPGAAGGAAPKPAAVASSAIPASPASAAPGAGQSSAASAPAAGAAAPSASASSSPAPSSAGPSASAAQPSATAASAGPSTADAKAGGAARKPQSPVEPPPAPGPSKAGVV